MKIKKWEIVLCVILLSVFAFHAVINNIINEQESISSKVIRMHVIANSDSNEDQALKLEVRDAVNEYIGNNLQMCTNKDSALEFINNNYDSIIDTAENAINDAGFDYPVDVVLSEEYYPTRDYDDFSMPAGKYTSLQVKIGNSEGKNWWCVVFPPLCTSTAIDSEITELDFTDEEIEFITSDDGKTVFKFKVLEIINKFRNKYISN